MMADAEMTEASCAKLSDPAMEMQAEFLKYAGWIRSTYSFVVDALSKFQRILL